MFRFAVVTAALALIVAPLFAVTVELLDESGGMPSFVSFQPVGMMVTSPRLPHGAEGTAPTILPESSGTESAPALRPAPPSMQRVDLDRFSSFSGRR